VAETLTILHEVYADTIENLLAIPVLRGRKSESERFPGAVETYTLEALMRDGKALQAATSHYLGQGFARTYDVRYTGRDGAEHHPYATSWGATTRLVGALVMAHGDDRGLRLPPLVAPQQVVIVPISRETDQSEVNQAAAAIRDELKAAGVRVRLDDRAGHRPGFKFNEWELKGVPVRLEVGSRDLAAGSVTVARRDTGEKQLVPLARAVARVQELLIAIQASLFRAALEERERRTLTDPGSYPEMIEYLREARGFVFTSWCGSAQCEARVKDESTATIRCLPLQAPEDLSATASAVAGRPRTGRRGHRRTRRIMPSRRCVSSDDGHNRRRDACASARREPSPPPPACLPRHHVVRRDGARRSADAPRDAGAEGRALPLPHGGRSDPMRAECRREWHGRQLLQRPPRCDAQLERERSVLAVRGGGLGEEPERARGHAPGDSRTRGQARVLLPRLPLRHALHALGDPPWLHDRPRGRTARVADTLRGG